MNYKNYISFGKYPNLIPAEIIKPKWIFELQNLNFDDNSKYLAFGNGKSYGDVCLNEDGILIDTKYLNHIISFDSNTGIIECEAGILLSDILEFIVPKKFFLPVTPGTKFISLGGAIANDIHGKNHHSMGNFGNHVLSFELLKSDGKIYHCSKDSNQNLFFATIGGLGLTGIILSAKFKCISIETPFINLESIKFSNLDEFFILNEESKNYTYTVSWVDCTSKGNSLGRGIYLRGEHTLERELKGKEKEIIDSRLPFPIEWRVINNTSTVLFNKLFYNKQIKKYKSEIVHYNPYFYPLDGVTNWNNAYGKKGFLQYQFVVPEENKSVFEEIFKIIVNSGLSSFLTVLKTFGEIPSLGMLSFPKKGITMAIDFSLSNKNVFKLLKELDKLVIESGGRVYPAKDARMQGSDFFKFYPNFKEFKAHIDESFSSSFLRRIMEK